MPRFPSFPSLRPSHLLLALLAAASAACGSSSGGDATPVGPTGPTGPSIRPAAIQLVSGNVQEGVVAAELPAPLVVRVVDAAGGPIAGQVVNFRVTAGEGSVFAGVGLTSAAGLAQERWTLGSTAGIQTLEARAVDPATGAAIVFATFQATARPAAPAQVSIVSGSGQAGAVSSLLPLPLEAKVSDRHGNAVPGVPVSFVVTSGGGSLTQATAATDDAGRARAAWALGPVGGTQRCEARAAGLAPAVFDALAQSPADAVASIDVSLVTSDLVVGHTTRASAVTRNADGVALPGRAVTWSSSDTAVAIVNASGDVTAIAVGSARIVATSEGRSGEATVTARAEPPAPVASVMAAVSAATIAVGEVAQASAVALDASGRELQGRTVTWTSTAPGTASVDAGGRVTGVAPGTASVVATCEGRSGSIQVSVIVPPPAPVATVSVALASTALYAGQATQATAVLRDASGAVLAGRAIAWTSSSPGVATVDGTSGRVVAVAPGTATITATSEGRSGSAAVAVSLVPVATVVTTLGSSTLVVGQSTQATATLRDAAGNALTGRVVTWATSDPAVATVGASGTVVAVGAGNATITATSEGQTGSASVSVADGACAWTPVRTESLATVPDGAIPGGGLAFSQGPGSAGGRSAYVTSSDWLELDVPANLAPTDRWVALDVDFWVDEADRTRRIGAMIFTTHAASSATPFWLNDYGEIHGLWAGVDHASPPAWTLQWRVPQVPLPPSGWGGGDVGTTAFSAPAAALAPGWHHLRIEGDRSTCAFDFAVDGVAGPSYQGACDLAGANVTLTHWTPLAGLTGAPVAAFSNLVVSRGSGTSCRPWTLVATHDLASIPGGAIAKTGALNGQGPASVAGRTAWLQHSDWNVLEIPHGLTALDDAFALEVDLLVPSGVQAKTTHLAVFNQDAGAPYQFTSGAQVFTNYLAGGVADLDWERRTPTGLVADAVRRADFSRDAWHTVRVEGSRSSCQFDLRIDGIPVASSTLPGCVAAGPYFTLVGGGAGYVPSDVAWSRLSIYRR